ncbi:MAG TPA: valine--tRNA ligase [Terracidiphilus sp.]|nr:valine--tRNA ligase [Terracidiphilus sp.]
MPHELPKAYDPTAIEDHWAAYWVRENLFAQPTPTAGDASGEPFTILLPPPNVTGRLHMGHMLNQTEMDILTRWQRMSGRRALWLPGTDHAGIATQMMVERQLASEGKNRQEMGREAFIDRVWEWKRHYGGAILDQMKRLGASVDWQREYFTLDERLSVAVREAFVRLYEQDMIYRGAYIVNWCPRCQTAISDLEVVYDEHKGHLWEIKYPVLGNDGQETGEFLTIATTRPETMLGDVAVAIHPEDERYLHLHGKKLKLPLLEGDKAREIPIILDDWVSRDFGTGAVKVTPAHDPNDFALGQRHHLPSINVMDDAAHINAEGGKYAGLDRFAARRRIVEDLEALGLLVAVKDHTHNVGHCDRCKTVVEPRLSLQWFVKIQPLADRAIAAVKDGHIKFTPEMYEKTYLNWMENIHDWCISRQLWWGHRIPAWHCSTCHKVTVARVDPSACAHCGAAMLTQETDVLDTWFSSGLLPVSVFGWPNLTSENISDFDTFYPTSLLVTGFDILFFWVARMIMLGCWFAGDVPMSDGSARDLKDSVPFREVYIHALVRDANREKMSKTKGNVIDPIEIVKQYGTDAVRFTLAAMASPGTDIAFNVDRTEGYRAFANKIWNAARFLFMNVTRAREAGFRIDSKNISKGITQDLSSPLESQWIVHQFNLTIALVNAALEDYRFDEAASYIYKFVWHNFCDWYLEGIKLRLTFDADVSVDANVSIHMLLAVFEGSLRLLSPFMPFLTEELWWALHEDNPPLKSIGLARFPEFSSQLVNIRAETTFSEIQDLVTSIRELRKSLLIGDNETTPVEIHVITSPESTNIEEAFRNNTDLLRRYVRISDVNFKSAPLHGPQVRHTPNFDVAVVYERTPDVHSERERLTKDIAKYEKGMAAAERQLGNEGFVAKAPAHIVEGLKKQAAETQLLLEKARAALAALPPE